MNLPAFLQGRPPVEAENVLHATSMSVLVPFLEAGLILSTELEYGFEDISLLATLSGILRDGSMAWHARSGQPTDFRVLQRSFVHAFRVGLDVAAQIHLHEGDGLVVDADIDGVLDGRRTGAVRPPLQELADSLATTAADVFVTFQNQSLAIAASSKNELLLGDFLACGCLWSALAGVEAGLTRLESPIAA